MTTKSILLTGLLLTFFVVGASSQRSRETVSGRVFLDDNHNGIFEASEKPLAGVMICNGEDIVRTDPQGHYSLSLRKDRAVFVVKPAGYSVPQTNDHRPQGYRLPAQIATQKGRVDFPLYKNEEGDSFTIALLGDPQVDAMDDIHHVSKLVTEELALHKPDFMVPLGDLTFDNLSMFDPLAKTLGLVGSPLYYTIGNHDLNFGKSHLHERDDSFEAAFGPSYYAFEYGASLFLVLNDIYPTSARAYEGRIDDQQMHFIQNLLALESRDKPVYIFLHIPLEFVENRQALLDLLQERENVFVGSGHTHTQYHNYYARPGRKPVHELVAGAVCGAWWQGPHDVQGIPFALMYDGTPKGYWYMHINQSTYTLDYKASSYAPEKQMDLWAPEVNEWDTVLNVLNTDTLYANIYAADAFTTVKLQWDNAGPWQSMERHEGVAPLFARLQKLQALGRFASAHGSPIPDEQTSSKHLWRFAIPKNLSPGPHLVTVTAERETYGLKAIGKKVVWVK
ncbi:calcineurin-like phosphoesterase C-terminal domain-containing protein [Chryseolinea lacunae]|uniref:Calcineurin-like phosphoesterase family protein n=1 Tax=Chryseolinea lacunae TaxID=2801331 RepID=A0ABS1KYV3_9BACT|nr:calcineurin-like phosphoesterase family protein [Chryseolinea lacunae]MBL0744437.1 calcineurin-like phosphoesterase family protein [Chryseolinea lacunae]